MHIKPAKPDMIVRDPMTMLPIPPGGKVVQDSVYWQRRLRDGDVVLVDAPATSPVAAENPVPEMFSDTVGKKKSSNREAE